MSEINYSKLNYYRTQVAIPKSQNEIKQYKCRGWLYIQYWILKKSINKIAKEYNYSLATIHRWLKKHEIKRRNRRYIRCKINENFFRLINTEEKAYWLGFLYADGYVKNKGNFCFSICLGKKDLAHIEKFRRSLNSTHKIYENAKYCKIDIPRKKMVKDLIMWGCIPRKSLKLVQLPNISNKLMKHFIRGVSDGDGCISLGNNYTNLSFRLSGNKPFIENINKFLIKNRIIKHHNKLWAADNIVTMKYSGKYAMKILNYLYEDSQIYLNRKYSQYKKMKQIVSNLEYNSGLQLPFKKKESD